MTAFDPKPTVADLSNLIRHLEAWRPALISRDARELDHPCPLFCGFGDDRPEFRRRAAKHCAAQLEGAPDPAAKRAEIESRIRKFASPLRGAERFDIEEIIDPRHSRRILCEFAELAARFDGVESMPSAELGAKVIGALTWIQEKPEYPAITTQLAMVAMNLKNLKRANYPAWRGYSALRTPAKAIADRSGAHAGNR